MATKDLSDYDSGLVPQANDMKFGIVVSEWNHEITNAMAQGAVDTLIKHGALENNIRLIRVPGSFELPLGGKFMAETGNFDAIILIGCVIQGETRHFDFICQGVTQGITDLNLTYGLPFIFGILTTDTLQQALDRSGGVHGTKGDEAAVTAIKMVALKKSIAE